MYYLKKQSRIYSNISDVDKIFQLGAISYKDHKKVVVNTIQHCTMRAHTIKNTNTTQIVLYKRRRVIQESDSDFSDSNISLNFIDRYNMDREQTDSNCNERDDIWFELVLN